VALPGLGVVYRNLEVHGQFRDNRLVLDQTHATSEKGSLDASGDFRFIG
jgi:autotransporter translocation and assembly factor TamB